MSNVVHVDQDLNRATLENASIKPKGLTAADYAARLFSGPTSLNDTLRKSEVLLPDSIKDLRKDIRNAARETCQDAGTSFYLLNSHYRRWAHRLGKAAIRKEYLKQHKEFSAQLKEQYPDASNRQIKKTAGQLCILNAAQTCGALTSLFPDGGKGFVRSFTKQLQTTEILYYALDVGIRALCFLTVATLSYLAVQVLDRDGFFTARYHMQTENEKCQDFASELEAGGYSKQAELFRRPNLLKHMREDVYRAFGYEQGEYDRLHSNNDEIVNFVGTDRSCENLHLPFVGHVTLNLGDDDYESVVNSENCLAEYDRVARIIEFHDLHKISESLLRHEITHSVFKVPGSIYSNELSADLMLDEGAALYVEDGKLDTYLPAGLNFALLNVLLGHNPEAPEFNADKQFEEGKRVFAQSFIDEGSFDAIKEKLDQVNGSGTFERVMIEPFNSLGGKLRFTAALLAEFETAGYDIEDVLGAWSPRYQRNGQLSGETNMLNNVLNDEPQAFALARELQRKYAGSSTGDLFATLLIERMFESGTNEEKCFQLAKDIIASERQTYWRFASQIFLLSNYKFDSEDERLALQDQTISENPIFANMIKHTAFRPQIAQND